jgi:leucyl aminopeptidase
MNIEVATAAELTGNLVALGIPVTSHEDGPQLAVDTGRLPTAIPVPAGLDPHWCTRHGFGGKVGQTIAINASASAEGPGTDVILVGLGDAAGLIGDRGLESLRRASAAFVRTVGRGDVAALVMPDTGDLAADRVGAAMAEGGALAAYRYDAFRTAEDPGQLGTLAIVVNDGGQGDHVAEGVARGARLAESVGLARDLVNEPPSSLTPEKFAGTFVRRFADRPSLSVEVWDEDRIVAERLGGLLGVARGSVQPPRFVRVEYQPPDPIVFDGHVPHLAMVGKGITFDSGGLSLKTAGGMETMKTDMGGGAAVLAALDAAAALGARIRITAFVPLTENMPGGAAIKPGDVLTTRNGKTIEVLNTDAEGRLVLSDGLALAAESEPDAIIDLATLTGAAVVALGKEIAGLLGNDEGLLAEVHAAGERAGEPNWVLPLPDDYRGHIDSEIADMRNVGRPGQAGSIAAALLLREFVGSVPWAHLDIAGPARSDENSRYLTKGGTGFGVRTLVAMVTSDEFARSLVVPVPD